MKSIDLVQTLNQTFPLSLLERLSGKFGLPAEALRQLVFHAGPALVASLMVSAATEHGARSLFQAIMSGPVNAHITQELPQLVETTVGLKELESVGLATWAQGRGLGPASVGELLSRQTGVPTQASYALTGVIAAALFGIIKHCVLLDQGGVDQLPELLASQWPLIAPQVDDALTISFGVNGVTAFRESIPPILQTLANTLRHQASAAAPVPEEPVTPVAVVSASPKKKWRLRRWVWVLLLAIVVALAYHFARTGLNSPLSLQSMGGPGGGESAAPPDPQKPAASAQTDPSNVVSGAVAASSASMAVAASASEALASQSSLQMASIAAPSSPVPALLKGSRFILGVNKAGAPTLIGTVASDTEKTQALDMLNRQFGAGRLNVDLTVDEGAGPTEWLSHINALLPLMSLPYADMTIEGHTIELGGNAADSRLGWPYRLAKEFGPSYSVNAFSSAQSVADATTAFRNAMTALAQTGSCDDTKVAAVLNLQVVDFAGNSGHIPESAKDNLGTTAQLLEACANAGKAIQLEINAFSDDHGAPQANMSLSTKRAKAVMDFLIHDGVLASSLTAHGYGVERPVASNLTQHGRFQNRRIEFVAAK